IYSVYFLYFFFFSSRRRHTRCLSDWSSDVCSSDLNAKIQLGSAGYFEASQFVPKLEIPKVVDRALGDVHPSGNPHVHLDPRNIARVAEALTERFVQLDPANTDIYKARGNSFRERWRAALSRWEQQAAP